VDFRNTVIVMTSNLGSDRIQENLSSDDLINDATTYAKVKEDVLAVVSRHFRPEFINRIDETVVFHPLLASQIRGIAEIQIDLLGQRLHDNDLALQVSDAVLDRLSELGYDPVYGARPLKRAVQTWVENPLAQKVIQGFYVPGDTITIDLNDGELVFDKQEKL
jgi:ATP-dependent Clp protease ATP-binding subunit ClpB